MSEVLWQLKKAFKEMPERLDYKGHDEEDWLDFQLDQCDNAFKQVPLGDEWVKDFVMFSYDVPLSKNFAAISYNTYMERYKRILMIHDGFKGLTSTDQVAEIDFDTCSFCTLRKSLLSIVRHKIHASN